MNRNRETHNEPHCKDSGFLLMCDEMKVQERHETEGILLALEDESLESDGKLEPDNHLRVLEPDMLKLRAQKEK